MSQRVSPIAGNWYKGSKDKLNEQIRTLFLNEKFGKGSLPTHEDPDPTLLGVISPHAGYEFSGSVASHSYYQLAINRPKVDVVIVIGPNHRGIGSRVSFYPEGYWSTPLGNVDIDEEILEFVNSFDFGPISDIWGFDETSHANEHSIEIQLPFLQFIYNNNFTFFPICLAEQSLYPVSNTIGKFLDNTISYFEDRSIVVVASTDLSHEYDINIVEDHDQDIIAAIENRNTKKIDQVRVNRPVTMCGYGSVYCLLEFARLQNPDFRVTSLKYANSGQITNSRSGYTVGYYSAKVNK